jgi:hypothetical protein
MKMKKIIESVQILIERLTESEGQFTSNGEEESIE